MFIIRKIFIITLLCLPVVLCFDVCHAVSIGEKSPAFQLSDSEGNVLDLNKLTTKPVLILFADKSGDSEEKLSELAGILDYYYGTELETVAVLVGESAESATEYQDELWLTYTLYGDQEGDVAQLYGVDHVPHVVILDNDHIVRHVGMYGTNEELRAELLQWMNEKVYFIVGRQFEYEPNIIEVNKGDTVVLKLVSEDVEHGIYLDGYELEIKQYLDREGEIVSEEDRHKTIKPGELGLLRFVADKSGRFSMRCSATCASFHPYMYAWLRVKPNTRFSVSVVLAFLLGAFFLYYFSKEKNQDLILGLFPIGWRFELTKYPIIRGLLKSRWPRFLAIIFSTVFFTVILVSCYVGGVSAGNYNFGIMYVWIVWFVLLIMIWVPFFSRVFCGFCPLPIFGLWAQRRSLMKVKKKSFGLNKKFPKSLSNMWLVNFLFMGITFFNGFLTTIPIASFIMLIGIIIGATVITFVFEKRTWCRYVCPVGGFQGLYSNAATIEVRCKDTEVCNRIKEGKEYPFDEGIAACRLACPAGVDSSSYIALIEKGQYERALEVIRESMPFPGVCGRICPAPCEDECSRAKVDGPIAIRALKRFVADYVGYENGNGNKLKPSLEGKVAVVGSGPSGLSGAYYLAKEGYDVTVYESLPVIGGMFKVGLPDFHLPKDIVDKEIAHIKNSGVKFITNTTVGKDISFEDLQKQYQAVFVAAGASKSRLLQLEGEDFQGVMSAISMLRKVNSGEVVEISKKVVVLGGGKTAIDAARTALRLGCEDVTCLEIRSEEEMDSMEKQAVEEGVKLEYLTSTLKIVGDNGKATSLLCANMRLGDIDVDTGLRKHLTIKGTEHLISADTIIIAVGQYSDISFLPVGIHISRAGTIVVDPDTMATNIPGVFAGGDVVTGPSVFVDSVKAGRKAAVSIGRYLRGEILEPVLLYPTDVQVADLPLHSISHKDRIEPEYIPVEERRGNFNEVEKVYTESMALEESSRCLGCGSCGMCYRGNENGYGCPWMELPFRNRRNTYCGLCLECFKTCPEDNMALNLRPPNTDLLVDEKRGFDEAWKTFIMLGAAVVFYVFMMGPWGFLKDWQRAATTFSIFKYIGTSAVSCLIVLPSIYALFVLVSNWLKKDERLSFRTLFLNYSYGLAPLGLFTWIAFCWGFLLPSGSYVIGVTSDPFAWGWDLFGTGEFPWTPFLTYYMPFLQIISLLLGLVVSIDIGIKISRQMIADKRDALVTFLPILSFMILWTLTMLWLFLW